MARLPTSADLSQPASFRSGRMISSADTSAIGRGLQAFGEGVSAFGESRKREGEKKKQQQNVVDLARAETVKTQRFLDLQNQFDQDGDYSTFGARAGEGTQKAINEAANLIRDPEMREKYLAQAQVDAVRTNDGIIDRGRALRQQAETNALDEALEANRRLYVDPLIPEDVKAKARNEIIGAVEVAGQAGLLTPDQVDARKKKFLDAADVSRAELEVDRDPGIILKRGGFEGRLVTRESSGKPGVVNPWGYAGLYQFGAPRMADLGIYEPQGENLQGWGGRKTTQGKWTGEFKIPGHPEVKKLADFLANPAAQKTAFEIHRQRMDQEIADRNLQGFIGQTIGGVKITRDGIHAMMHLGGAGGAARALRSGGAINAADANGSTLLSYAKLGEDGPATDLPDYVLRMSPEDREAVRKKAEARQNQINAETRAGIEVVAENAPTAIFNTGSYDQPLPSLEQFQTAYGPVDGAERYGKFQASVETSQQAYGMRTMSVDEIQGIVQSATPRSSGNDAALEQARYDALSKAAVATLKARSDDPASYVRQHFPSVGQAWTSRDQAGGFQSAVAASIAAQQQIGIPDPKPLPKDLADTLIGEFKDETLPEADRINSVASVLMATPDPEQQRAIFEQMVEAGLPDMTEGAFVALSRGDAGAANRLFRAALVDPSKLPGKAPATPAQIDDQVQSDLMDVNQIGDLYYGLSDGTAENLVRAQRDSKLLNNAVNLRLRNGETLDAAVAAAGKDLYGDVKPVTDGRAQILIPSKEDEDAYLEGLDGLMPQVEAALAAAVAVPADAPTSDGTRAVMDATSRNYISNVLSEGYFRNAGDGFVFIDPFTGGAVAGQDGQPMVFSTEQVMGARGSAPAPVMPSDPESTVNDNVQTEMQMQEERVRQMYEGAQ